MKHLTGIDHEWTSLTNGLPTWTVRTHLAVPYLDEPEVHCHIAANDILEWRMAEYDITDIDDAIHLVMHEWMLSHYLYRKAEVNLWTPGHSRKSALTHQLKRIDSITGATDKKLNDNHKKLLHKNPIHKHGVFDPLRERGVHDAKLYARKLHVDGHMDLKNGKHVNGRVKIDEANQLLALEQSSNGLES